MEHAEMQLKKTGSESNGDSPRTTLYNKSF